MTRPPRTPRDDGPLTHDERCPRRRPPVLVAGWDRAPLLNCPDCGRTAPAADQRPAKPDANAGRKQSPNNRNPERTSNHA